MMMDPGSSNSMMKSKQANSSEDGHDMISNLPDAIIHLILSLLPTTEEVSRTSILSRRWRYLWTSIPSIDIDYSRGLKFPTEFRKSKLEKFVDWILISKSFKLDSFHLCCVNYYNMSTVTRWIYAVVTRNIKSLHLEFFPEDEAEDIAVPNCLVTCGSLEELRLYLFGQRLILPNFKGFPALRVLELSRVELSNDDLVKDFFNSCPLLEELSLIDCIVKNLNVLCISCPNLKNLRIEAYEFSETSCGTVKIVCPKLVFLEFRAVMADAYIFESTGSLKKAVIHPEESPLNSDKALRELLVGISQVEYLSTSGDTCSLIAYPVADVPISLPNLKTLELTVEFATYNIEDLIQILVCLPHLESLHLNIDEFYNSWDDLHLQEAEMRILTCHLRRVEFLCFDCDGPMRTIARSLLENTIALEEMVFRLKCNKVNFHEKSMETMKEVSRYHKASPIVKLVTLL